MSKIVTTLDNAVAYINTLYNYNSTPPAEGEEDYTVWTSLLNISINLWEREEGMLWEELFVKLADASDGDKTTTAGVLSYSTPTDFIRSAVGYIWLGDNTSKTPYRVIKTRKLQRHENDMGNWCYFLMDGSPTLEFNPNLTFSESSTINYAYYKNASKLTTGSDVFEMSDPMFAIYFALSELKKDEGNQAELTIASEKMNSMKTYNEMPAWLEEYSFSNR